MGISLLCVASGAFAQAPFTIRRPLDGATVREKVRVEIPRASVDKPGSFVAFFIDDKFVVAQAPEGDPKAKTKQPFVYVWDTKTTSTSDGEHKIKAVLFEGAEGGSGGVREAGTTEVKITVANKVNDGPSSLLLRYKYREGENLEYARNSSTKLKGGEQEGATGTGDTELGSVRSKLLLGIEDSRAATDVSLIRNKLTSLSLLTGGQEITATTAQLSESMYQELDSRGKVLYETGSLSGLAEFAMDGVPVGNSLELPVLPQDPVSVGSSWRLPNQRIDIPGVPSALQPRVLLESKLEGLEWESNRPAAKIVQKYDGELPMPVRVSGMLITTPSVSYERVIYFAYKSGVLLRVTRNLTIKGRTMDAPSASPAAGGGMAGMGSGGMMAAMMGGAGRGMMGGGGGMGGPGGPPANIAAMMGGAGRGMMGGGGGQTGPPANIAAMMGSQGRGRSGRSGGQGRGQRGSGSMGSAMGAAMGAMMGAGQRGSGNPFGGGGGSNPFGGGGGMGGNRFGGNTGAGERDRGVTIESSQNTELFKVS
jgi:hypothetical protein